MIPGAPASAEQFVNNDFIDSIVPHAIFGSLTVEALQWR